MAATSTSRWRAPHWVNSLYAKFPLVTLEQEDVLDWKQDIVQRDGDAPYCLWVSPGPARSFAHCQVNPPLPANRPHYREWASGSPAALRAQLLFLLRGVEIHSRVWSNVAAAPSGKLPALHRIRENRLVAADDIRGWLDTEHPLKGKSAKYVLGTE